MSSTLRFLIPVVLPLAIMTGACNSGSHQPGSVSVDSSKTSVAVGKSERLRDRQIAALRAIRNQLDDTTGLAFSDAFSFPVPEEAFYPYVEQDAFRREYRKADQKMSKTLFLQHFPEIARSIELPEFQELFRQIPPERLLTSDSIHAEKRSPKEACFRYYSVQITGDDLVVQYGSDHDTDAMTTEEEDGVVCEWASMWTFRFDGNTWRFVSMQQAG